MPVRGLTVPLHVRTRGEGLVVGQKVARSTAEPASPHRRRHGRRERARQRRIASARNFYPSIYLSIMCERAGCETSLVVFTVRVLSYLILSYPVVPSFGYTCKPPEP